ncbi:TlpA family protein disulfide reductase [Marinoscillum pacificum]|uniref:TlpA family protein disulfide reductase n=1 Tax=Marinoscillum pacificum TaxID=392723 RepID=UPI002157E9C0|nr:TlpA disulfide reductase family protein [Marinoscillum pacificum]
MKRSYLLLVIIVAFSCAQQTPEELLSITRDKYNSSNYISLTATSYWPDMLGIVDTTLYKMEFINDGSPYLGYGFVIKKRKADVVYLDGMFQRFEHIKTALKSYDSASLATNNTPLTKSTVIQYNPLTLLEMDWNFSMDSLLENKKMMVYESLERDTVYEGLKVKVFFKLYINPASNQVAQFERLAYQDGNLGQKMVWTYRNSQFDNEKTALHYDLPESYVSITDSGYELMKVGDKAPDFKGITLAGDSISLSQYLGKKILVDISVINCGYCKEALEYINQSKNIIENIETVYINPEDDIDRMRLYKRQVAIPFPVIAGREDLGRAFGVNGYPTFIVINEEGIIEQVQQGYTKEFLDQFM